MIKKKKTLLLKELHSKKYFSPCLRLNQLPVILQALMGEDTDNVMRIMQS